MPIMTAGRYIITLLLAGIIVNSYAQKIYTFAGDGTPGFAGDGQNRQASIINFPQAIIFDNNRNLYFADASNNRIRKIDTNGIVTTVAGNGSTVYADGPALLTGLNLPLGLAIDSHGDIYISDSFNHSIRKLTVATGVVSTYAGTGSLGYSGDNFPAVDAQLNWPRGICFDNADNLYIADNNNHVVRKVTPAGIITTIAGNNLPGYTGDGIAATGTRLNFPSGVAVDLAGNVYIADNSNNRVRKVDVLTGFISTIAGDGTSGPVTVEAGPAITNVVTPTGLKLDEAEGVLYVADELHDRIRAIAITAATISTVAGTTTGGYNGEGIKADQAQLGGPVGVAIDASSNIFIAEANNHRLRWIPKRFVTTWKTDNPGTSSSNQVTIPTDDLVNLYDIHWEEVGVPANKGALSNQAGPVTITFPSAGTYRVEISGNFRHIYFWNNGSPTDEEKILTVEQWGAIAWSSMNGAFQGCHNLTVPATDYPDLSNVLDMGSMFYDATVFNSDISDWDVSNVVNMFGVFQWAIEFNQNINDWDVSNVTNMRAMFFNASSFNQDLSGWDVGNVTDFSVMFGSTGFNQDISGWDLGSAFDLEGMFFMNEAFNQDIGGWNVSNVINLNSMFFRATSFNQDLDAWDVGNVINTAAMFSGASAFNGNVESWDVSNVTTMLNMFYSAGQFNRDIGNWDVSNVTNMQGMFYEAFAFNQDISGWSVGNVTNMSYMFTAASAFNQDLDSWDVSNVTNMTNMFASATVFNGNIDTWDVSNVTDMSFMLSSMPAFNRGIGSWNVGNVTTMAGMFTDSPVFNQDIGNWDVSSVTDMGVMFYGTTAFNSNIGNWNVSSVIDMNSMFQETPSFDQDLSAWNFANVIDMHDMLINSGLSVANYDAFLTAVAQTNLNTGLTLNADGLGYCAAATARETLITSRNWTIEGDALACDVPVLFPDMNIEHNRQAVAQGASMSFPNTGIGLSSNQLLKIKNIGGAQLVVTDVQVTGDNFAFVGTVPPPIDPGDSLNLEFIFEPTVLGEHSGTISIYSNDEVPVYTINIIGTGDADIEVYNVVTPNPNGKHDFLNIRNIELFPNNRVTIYDRWGNLVFEHEGYDNASTTFAGATKDNKQLPEGTYYYVIDKNNGSANVTGFLLLRR